MRDDGLVGSSGGCDKDVAVGIEVGTLVAVAEIPGIELATILDQVYS